MRDFPFECYPRRSNMLPPMLPPVLPRKPLGWKEGDKVTFLLIETIEIEDLRKYILSNISILINYRARGKFTEKGYTKMEAQVERAKALLENVLLFDSLGTYQPAKVIMREARLEHIPKAAVRQARKELGVLSLRGAGGEQYWVHPSRIVLPTEDA